MAVTLNKSAPNGRRQRVAKITGSRNGAARVSPRQSKKLTAAERRSDRGQFATHLAALMREREVTTEDLAKAARIDAPTIRRWLRAEVLPNDLTTLKKLRRALDTTEHPMPDYRLILPPE